MIDKNDLIISEDLNENDSVFRYITLAQFISLIEHRKLFLKKVKLWDDPWEVPDDQLPIIRDNGELIFTESMIAQSTVGQRWTSERDSDAMWRIYSHDKQGVMIEACVNNFRLIKNLKHACLLKVIYFNNTNYIEKRKEMAKYFKYYYGSGIIFKRDAFKHENEVRLLVCLQGYQNEIEDIWDIPVVGFDIDPESFIKSITFDPRADEWFVETMKKYCESKGLICPIEKSSLYERDFYESAKIVRAYELVK